MKDVLPKPVQSPIVMIDTARIVDWPTFHAVFAEALGFADFYGKNLNAWIDCMTYLDDAGAGMSRVHCDVGGVVTLELTEVTAFSTRCAEQYQALIECVAFVNWRRVRQGDAGVLALAFHRESA